MRKILLVGFVLFAVFVAVFRQRIFLRDPLGKVERNGVAQSDARVFINYSNDVLIENPTQHQFLLVQGWNKLPGTPKRLDCFTGMMCWTDADEASVFPAGPGAKVPVIMSAKEVTYTDELGIVTRVTLR